MAVGLGLWQSRYNKGTNDYFLAGRNLPWWMVMFSIVATETSVLTFISIPGIAYRGNWVFLQLAMGYIVGRFLVAAILLPGYYSSGITSIYETLNVKYGVSVQKYASLIFLVTRVLADGVRFLATAAIVQVVSGWSLTASILVMGVVTLIYTVIGGIRTVVWIDSFQFILYLSGAVISILFILMNSSVPPWELVRSSLDAGKMHIFSMEGSIFTNPWNFIAAFAGGALLSFASHGADYMMVQRVLGCRNLRSAQKAMVGSGIFVFIQFTLFLFVGTLIYSYFGGVTMEKDREFSTFIVQHLPVGLKGLLLAGVLSAAMSTLSSSINALASSTVMDWMKKRATLNFSKIISIFWGMMLMGVALTFDQSDTAVVIVGLKIASYTYGALLGMFLISKMKKQFSPAAVITGMTLSMAAVFLLQYWSIAWTWFIGIAVIVNIMVTWVSHIIINAAKSRVSR